MSKERPVRVFVSKHLSLRDREVKVTVLTLILDGSGTGEVQLGFNKNLIQLDRRSTIHPKLKSKLDVEYRKTLDSTARPRRQTLFA